VRSLRRLELIDQTFFVNIFNPPDRLASKFFGQGVAVVQRVPYRTKQFHAHGYTGAGLFLVRYQFMCHQLGGREFGSIPWRDEGRSSCKRSGFGCLVRKIFLKMLVALQGENAAGICGLLVVNITAGFKKTGRKYQRHTPIIVLYGPYL
jgi:hypothetical protein